MKIVLIGQAAFGEQVLKRLLEKGEEVVGVSAPVTPAGGRPDPLWVLAEEKGLPVFGTRDLKKNEVFEQIASLEPDINVMAFVTDILDERVLEKPKLGTIQYHPSLLPKHRGASAMNWAIVTGEGRTGLTIFWPDRGVDTGPVLLQKEVDIGPDDTMGSLYFGNLFPMGVDAMAEAVDLVKSGKAPRTAQDDSKATSDPIFKEEHAVIDWGKPSQEVLQPDKGLQPAAWRPHHTPRAETPDLRLQTWDGASQSCGWQSCQHLQRPFRGGPQRWHSVGPPSAGRGRQQGDRSGLHHRR